MYKYWNNILQAARERIAKRIRLSRRCFSDLNKRSFLFYKLMLLKILLFPEFINNTSKTDLIFLRLLILSLISFAFYHADETKGRWNNGLGYKHWQERGKMKFCVVSLLNNFVILFTSGVGRMKINEILFDHNIMLYETCLCSANKKLVKTWLWPALVTFEQLIK